MADDKVTTLRDERGRHATNLELFLDLVFVFAVTQIAGVLGSDLTLEGFSHGLLLAWLVWWLWSQFAWLGTAVDLGGRSTAQWRSVRRFDRLLAARALSDGADRG